MILVSGTTGVIFNKMKPLFQRFHGYILFLFLFCFFFVFCFFVVVFFDIQSDAKIRWHWHGPLSIVCQQ